MQSYPSFVESFTADAFVRIVLAFPFPSQCDIQMSLPLPIPLYLAIDATTLEKKV
jgi:hypothetical protein